ncbi:MAG: Na(+)-translocating NADH-quinone reductase subunit F [Bacteroidia bacterium]|nr:Na(+)-translocating NADH-quinone reductase subunit F [Bacteroidia bacterium]NNF30701.1 Na(+)-translocating NADH-quinone reductase subunit F [Flavobacteriaceae bacterium]MBT8277254.1 Na(+)-translocating NADH-quinone reductase subunit F [Bacteroidia bacterium]NNJ80779.1 Na(+)-translocating NADH-quinone reductase subunit F [Flavobacteriaceae bacterium]NNK54854.1 Na(+)-translocating NADH-quinone reductase subunit F [Flavobacteriaceae bacterium]
MKTTSRFDQAVQKLYNAFHNNNLHPECAMQCAVGNICDNKDAWKHFSDFHGSLCLNYVGRVHEGFGRRINGYLPSELLKIEAAFLEGCGYVLPLHHSNPKPENPVDKTILFNGLCASVSVLCELDGISNVMDTHVLFDYERQAPLMSEALR